MILDYTGHSKKNWGRPEKSFSTCTCTWQLRLRQRVSSKIGFLCTWITLLGWLARPKMGEKMATYFWPVCKMKWPGNNQSVVYSACAQIHLQISNLSFSIKHTSTAKTTLSKLFVSKGSIKHHLPFEKITFSHKIIIVIKYSIPLNHCVWADNNHHLAKKLKSYITYIAYACRW